MSWPRFHTAHFSRRFSIQNNRAFQSIPDLNVQYMSTRLFQSDVDLKSKNVALRRNPPSKQEANFQYSKREFVETPILSHIAGKKFFCTGGCRRPDKLFGNSRNECYLLSTITRKQYFLTISAILLPKNLSNPRSPLKSGSMVFNLEPYPYLIFDSF